MSNQFKVGDEARRLLLKYAIARVLCGKDGLHFYECKECRRDDHGFDHAPQAHSALLPEDVLHTENCPVASALTLLSDTPPGSASAKDFLTPEYLLEVLQEYAPASAKAMGWQRLKQIAEALVLPELRPAALALAPAVCICCNGSEAEHIEIWNHCSLCERPGFSEAGSPAMREMTPEERKDMKAFTDKQYKKFAPASDDGHSYHHSPVQLVHKEDSAIPPKPSVSLDLEEFQSAPAVPEPSTGNTLEDYQAYLADCKEKNYRAAYNAAAEDGYHPSVNWRALREGNGEVAVPEPSAEDVLRALNSYVPVISGDDSFIKAANIGNQTPDQQITMTKIQAITQGVSTICAAAPVVTFSNGTVTATLTLTSGKTAWDSAVDASTGLPAVFPPGTAITASTTAGTCATPPTGLSLTYTWQSFIQP